MTDDTVVNFMPLQQAALPPPPSVIVINSSSDEEQPVNYANDDYESDSDTNASDDERDILVVRPEILDEPAQCAVCLKDFEVDATVGSHRHGSDIVCQGCWTRVRTCPICRCPTVYNRKD